MDKTQKQNIYLIVSEVARYFSDAIKESDLQIYHWILDTVNRIESYYCRDEELIRAAIFYNDKFTYTELKKIKDNNPENFKKLYTAIH